MYLSKCFAVISLLVAAACGFAQNPYTPDVGNVGIPENGVFSGGSIDTIQLNNGNLHVDIPLLHLPGIGMDTDIHLVYDNMLWNQQTGVYPEGTTSQWEMLTMSHPFWQIKMPLGGYLKWGWHPVAWECSPQFPTTPNSGNAVVIDSMTFTDPDGTAHQFPVKGYVVGNFQGTTYALPPYQCVYGNNGVSGVTPIPTSVYSEDSESYHLTLNQAVSNFSLTDKHGNTYQFSSSPYTTGVNYTFSPAVPTQSQLNVEAVGTASPEATFNAAIYLSSVGLVGIKDANGNQMTCCTGGVINSGVYTSSLTDTVGRAISLSDSQTGNNGVVPGVRVDGGTGILQAISYLDQNKNPQSINIGFGPVTINLVNADCSLSCGPYPGSPASTVVANLPTSIALQNGETYTITYLQGSLGEIQSIALPTGATISYTWGTNPAAGAFTGNSVTSRTVSGGGQTSVWNYNYAVNPQWITDQEGNSFTDNLLIATVTDPNQNDTVFTCTNLLSTMAASATLNIPQTCYMTAESIYSGSSISGGTQLVSKTTNYSNYGCSWLPGAEVFSWIQSGQTTETDSTYDSSSPPTGVTSTCPNVLPSQGGMLSRGNIKSKMVYDYTSSTTTKGALLSNTQYSYLHESNSAYVTANIVDRVSQVAVYNSATVGSSTLVAQTTTGYDAFNSGGQSGLASTASSPTTQHDYVNFGTGNTLRGLPTSVTKCTTASCSASIVSYMNYNDLGKETVATDALGHSTYFAYGQQNAFIASTTMPNTTTNGVTIHHVVPQYQDLNTGLLVWKGTQNSVYSQGQTTAPLDATQYTYDNMFRALTVLRPDGGSTTNTYPNPNYATSAVTEDAQRTATTTTTLDGLGRKVSTGTTSDAICGPLTVDTGYDVLGRVQWVSNPHCSSPQVTDGYTTYTYDAIGRLSKKLNPDGTTYQHWNFNGSAIDFYDETNRHWRHTYDAKDRLIQVLEPDSGNVPSLETDYSYDTLGNLLLVNQYGGAKGSSAGVNRQFSYDALSRLIASNNPESASAASPAGQTCTGAAPGTKWTSCYSYDSNGNLIQKTDNRGISIYYSYDVLNRLLTKTYSDSTPPVTFSYDASSISGGQNLIGQMTGASVMSGSTLLAQSNTYSYDTMGRLLSEQQCTPATNCTSSPYQLAYLYDWAGKPTSLTFPSNAPGGGNPSGQPLVLTYTYDQAERLLTAGSNWAASGDAKHPGMLFQSSTNMSYPGYGPMGLQNALLGINATAGTTTATLQRGYDNRGRAIEGAYGTGGGAITGSTSSGSITISGSESQVTKPKAQSNVVLSDPTAGMSFLTQSNTCQNFSSIPPTPYTWTSYSDGSVTITVQAPTPFTVSASWGQSDENPADVRTALVSGLNTTGSPVTSVLNANGTITLTSVATGVTANYPVTVVQTQGAPQDVPGPPSSTCH